jgi:hypothetical protein
MLSGTISAGADPPDVALWRDGFGWNSAANMG